MLLRCDTIFIVDGANKLTILQVEESESSLLTLNSSSIPKFLGLHDKFTKSLRTASWKLIVIGSTCKSSKFAKLIYIHKKVSMFGVFYSQQSQQ